jgi:hypothetical protein
VAYSFQTFTFEQVLTSAQMNQVEANVRDHVHGVDGVLGIVDVQTFPTDGDWTKPIGISADSEVFIQIWGPGDSGASRSTTGNVGGGGGGGYSEATMRAGDLGATVACTVPVGAVGVTGNSNGNLGSNASFGTHVIVVPGTEQAENNGTGTGTKGGDGGEDINARAADHQGGNPTDGAANPGNFGGASGGGVTSANATFVGGDSNKGGAGGGAVSSNTNAKAGGTSRLGGDGGAANEFGDGVDGSTPGGGGGASTTGTSGAGGDALIIVTTRSA